MALRLLEEDIKLPTRQILLKPNFVSTTVPLAATHVDAMKSIVDFLLDKGARNFLIGEASAERTWSGFQNFGYLELESSYPVKLIDLNEDKWVETKILDRNFNPIRVRVSATILNSYRVSVTRPKTHDTCIVTLSLKNIAMGSLIDGDKGLVHQGYKAFNLNLVKLAKLTMPHLSIIDGTIGMEGNGPVSGTAINSGFTVASTNALACDLVTTELMGFDFRKIGYLWYATQIGLGPESLDEIEVIGERIESCRKNFRPHRGYKEQLNWQFPEWEKIFAEIDVYGET